MSGPPSIRSFSYREGICIEGTSIACDSTGLASDLVFVSHGQAVSGLSRKRLGARRMGRTEIIATAQTVALLGSTGQRLESNSLPAVLGRPFVLGGARLELLPTGHLPGAAALLVETNGRRIMYAGTIRRGPPAFGAVAQAIRHVDAVCVDATFGDPRFVLPPVDEALAQVRRFVEQSLATGHSPVILAPAYSTALDVAASLGSAGFSVRGHLRIIEAAKAFRAVGANPGPILPFHKHKPLGVGQALLWPPEERDSPRLSDLRRPRFALVSGFSLDPDAVARVRPDTAIAMTNQSGFSDLLAFIAETGAREVAVHRGFAESFAAHLRGLGLDAYAVGPPRQLDLFRG